MGSLIGDVGLAMVALGTFLALLLFWRWVKKL